MIDIQQATLFDYGSLDSDTRVFVQEQAVEIHGFLIRTADGIVQTGIRLEAVKGRLDHGQFQSWVRTEFAMHPRTAEQFMMIARKFRNANLGSHLTFTILRELASPSTPDMVVEQVTSGQVSATLPAIREAKQEAEIINHTPAALQSSESNEWYTPWEYIAAARELMGAIDVDPASNEFANQVVQAEKFYTKEQNGLMQSWRGRVWLNPPYGFDSGASNQELWSRQLIERFNAGLVTEAILLVNAVPGNKWFQPLWNYLICFPDHRIRFYNAEIEQSQPTHSNALVYLGQQRKRFIEIFNRFGTVVERAKSDGC